MCWIFAYNWKKDSVKLLINWLRALEYRWYDSAWIYSINNVWEDFYVKSVWRVSNLSMKVDKEKRGDKIFNSWIAHTRWATHGKVTEDNSHPHHSQKSRFYIVHNWIIENYKSLKQELEKKYTFYSDTDTEVIAKLIEDSFEIDLKTTLEKIIKKLVWAYAIWVIDSKNPETLIWVKLWSPLLVWEWEEWVFLSSDINALSSVVHSYTSIEDNEMVIVKNWSFSIFSSGEIIKRDLEDMNIEYSSGDKWNYSTFTEKEIFEIPEVLENAMRWRIDFESKEIIGSTFEELNEHSIERIEIIASGSSYLSWGRGMYYFKELSWIPTTLTISSEFLCTNFISDDKTLYIFLSQSWETADVREALKIVKSKWWLTFWIVNSVWSTIAKLVDMGLYCHSWVEVWVASTKNIIAQDLILLLMALSMWSKRWLQHSVSRWIIEELELLKDKLNFILINYPKIKDISKIYQSFDNMFFLGRNLLYPVAWEWALKTKELTYIHCEDYSTWELKHWPLALVWPKFPCVVLNTSNDYYSKTVSNIKEIRARDGRILWIITAWKDDKELYDDVIEVPETSSYLANFTIMTAMFLFSTYMAEWLWKDVDKPQNLAKSVTVE